MHKRQALTIIAYLNAKDDIYKIQRSKFNIINIGSNRTSNIKEDDLKHIRKRKDGRWEFRRMINGETYHCINKDFEVVRKFGTDLNKRLKGSLQKDDGKNITFYAYALEYYDLYKSNKRIGDKTKEEYETAHNVFKENFNVPFRKLRAEDFQRFINKTAKEHPTKAVKLYNKICAICKKAYHTGLIVRNIAEIIEKPDVEEKIRRALTYSEQVVFLEKIKIMPMDFQMFCIFCIITSARREEAAKLRPEHLDAKDGTLFINGTKTMNAPRTIKVTNTFIKLLQKIGVRFEHTADYYSRKAKEIFEEMGAHDLVLNCLRHTCATNMVYLGIPSDYRKHIMGHSTTVITDRVYTHIDPKVKKKDIEKLYKDLYFTDF